MRRLANFCQRSPGIFSMQRALAVHHFVVAEHEDEMLVKGVEQREGDVALVERR